MKEAAAFLSPGHLRVLADWTAHPRSDVRFRVTPSQRHEGADEFRLGYENVLIRGLAVVIPPLWVTGMS